MQDRARSLLLVTFVLVLAGVAARADRSGHTPAPCEAPGVDARGDLVCGGGAPLATRAWLAGGTLDLNEATAAQLVRLPGVGPRTAAAIVEDRAARGPLPSVAALVRVKGVGPKTVARIARLVSVSGSPGEAPAP